MEQLSINIQNAGTLKDLLDNTIIKELQHLQLSGYLNGDDIRYLREILSSSRYNRIHLDLLNTSILNGGGGYIYHYDYEIDLETHENEIGDYMFLECYNLLSIILPRNITHIGDAAFQNCTYLKSIVISEYVTDIFNVDDFYCDGGSWNSVYYSPFDGCRQLEEFIVSEDNRFFSSKDGVLFDKKQTRLISVPFAKRGVYVVPSGVTQIDSDALSDCSYITSLYIPANAVFRSYSSSDAYLSKLEQLEYLDIYDTIFTNDFGGVYSCPKLKEIRLHGEVSFNFYSECPNLSCINCDDYFLYFSKKNERLSVVFKDIESIPEYIFYRNNKIETVTISSVTRIIEKNAFAECEHLKTVDIGGVVEIGTSAFEYCQNLSLIKLGTNLHRIGISSFSSCIRLEKISLPNSVIEIDKYSFCGCNNLYEVELPNNLEFIHEGAFAYCTRLFRFELTNKIKVIEEKTFKDCSSLTSIRIGENIKTIGRSAFANCYDLAEIYCMGLEPPHVHITAFDGVNLQNCKLYVKSICLKMYRTDEQWKRFIKEEKQSLQQPITNKQFRESMFNVFFDKCKKEFIYQRGEMQYGNLYDKIRESSSLKDLCKLSIQGGVIPNAVDFKMVAMMSNTLFGFRKLLTRVAALIALKIWHETVNSEYNIASDATLYNTAQNIIKLIS